jgi:hypothetical protein
MRQFAFLAPLAAVLLGLPNPVSAGEPAWVAVGRGEGFTDFVDAGSIGIRAGRLTAWTLTSFTTPQHSEQLSLQPYLSLTTLSMYDCSGLRSAALDRSFYTEAVAQGEVLKTLTVSPASVVVKRATPGSLAQTEIETVCKMWEKEHKDMPNVAGNKAPI